MSSENDIEAHENQESQSLPPVVEIERPRRRRRSRSPLNKRFRKLKRWIKWKLVLATIVVLVTVTTLTFAVLITDATTRLESSWKNLNRVLSGISGRSGTELTLTDIERLQAAISDLSRQIASTRTRAGYIKPLISLNGDWQASLNALESAQLLGAASHAMLEGVYPALNFLVQGESDAAVSTRISSGERVVDLLELGRGRFVSAQENLRMAEAELKTIDLTDVSSNLILQVEQLRDYQQQLVSINETILIAPDVLTTMMGLNGERTYLVLAQNNDEIRPSGGYISTYGWFTVEGGRIIDFDYSPTTANSPNPPDEDFLDTFESPDWWIPYGEPIYVAWDGSWYVDFPSTAQLSLDYYDAGGNPHSPVDGVLAIDISGFELMLSALGSVPVEEYGKIVTAENFRELVYDIRAFGEGVTPHKQFVATVYQSIFEKWQSLDSEQTPDLLSALLQGLQTRHIMLYFADSDVTSAIAQLGWTGSQLPATDYDYILVADANLGNKSNNSINRSLTYDVIIQADGSLLSNASLRYDYFASVAENDPAIDEAYHGQLIYQNLMQIFLPVGVTIIDSSALGLPSTISLDTHTLLVTRTQVAYDSSERYQLEYQTEPLIEDIGKYKRYRLLIQKQPGARLQSVNVQISLPDDSTLISASPAADAIYSLEQVILDFRLDLDSDQWIEVIYQSN